MALTVSILLLLAVIFFVLRFVRSRFGAVSDLPDSDLPDSDLLDNGSHDPNPGRQESVLDDLWCYPLFSTERRIQNMVVAGVLGSIVLTVLEWRVIFIVLPLWGLTAVVALYLHFSRSKDSL